MATQTVRVKATPARPEEERRSWRKLQSFFGLVADACRASLRPVCLGCLEGEYRARLSVKERTLMDYELSGFRMR